MVDIRPLEKFDAARFQQVASGYTTSQFYRVQHDESDQQTIFSLILEHLPEPNRFQFPFSEEELDRYEQLVPGRYCLGAFDSDELVAVSLAEPQMWNNTLWVWEFHVASTHRGRGIGRRLMDQLAMLAGEDGLRALICETQNTNVAAIRFYRAVGYRLEGVDISYYTNEDMLPGRTVAVFMKRRLT